MGDKASRWVSGLAVILASACAPAVAPRAPASPAEEPEPAAPPDAPPQTPQAADAERTVAEPDRSEARPDEAVPTSCADDAPRREKGMCLVGEAYAKRLCAGAYPELALGFFAKGTPWTRAYLRGDVEAWNASGGLTHRAQLAFDEEVIVLARHGAASTGGIVMTGAQASYDVLRWDGSCVSISEGEMTTKKPPAPKTAVVPWKRLDPAARRALLASPPVKQSSDAVDKACSASDDEACEKRVRVLSSAIANHVRAGGALPPPPRRP